MGSVAWFTQWASGCSCMQACMRAACTHECLHACVHARARAHMRACWRWYQLILAVLVGIGYFIFVPGASSQGLMGDQAGYGSA